MKPRDKQKQGQEWYFSFWALREEAGQITAKICPTHGLSAEEDFAVFKNSLIEVGNGSQVAIDAFQVVFLELPKIRERIKQLPRCDWREGRVIQKLEIDAQNEFLQACIYGMKWLEAPILCTYERAALGEFSQAHKLWRESGRISSGFWDKLVATHYPSGG